MLTTNHGVSAPPTALDAGRSLQKPSLVAGVALLLLSGLAAVGYVVIVQGLVTPGDPSTTAREVIGSEGVFRLGVGLLYAVVVLDVVVAWALYAVFTPTNGAISRLAAWFRLAFATVFTAAIGQLAGVPDVLGNTEYSASFTPEQLHGQAMLKIDAFTDIYMAALILFGVHLCLLGYLAYTSGYVPRFIGVLLVIAGVGYAFDSFVTVFTAGSPFAISTITFLGEFVLALWLLFRGRTTVLQRSPVDPPLRRQAL